MATISINVPNQITSRIGDALADRWNYTGFHLGIPETKMDFIKRKIIEYIKSEVKAQESLVIKENAIIEANNQIDSNNSEIEQNILLT